MAVNKLVSDLNKRIKELENAIALANDERKQAEAFAIRKGSECEETNKKYNALVYEQGAIISKLNSALTRLGEKTIGNDDKILDIASRRVSKILSVNILALVSANGIPDAESMTQEETKKLYFALKNIYQTSKAHGE